MINLRMRGKYLDKSYIYTRIFSFRRYVFLKAKSLLVFT